MGIQINGQTDTVTATDGSINVGGDVTIPGVLTYEDVTNVDSVGIVTAQAGIRVTGGSVGIGTATPSTPLEIYSDPSAAWKFRINTSVSDGAGFYQRANGDFEVVLRDASNNNNYIAGTSGGLQFVTGGSGGSEKLRITSGGAVGINTTTPISPLEIQGVGGVNDSRITFTRHGTPSNNSVIGELFYRIGTDSVAGMGAYRESAMDDAYLAFYTQPTSGSYAERLRITSAGKTIAKSTHSNGAVNEGLRLTTLGTYSSSNSSNAGPAISFGQFHGNYPTWTTAQIAGIRKGNNWDGALVFYTNSGSSQTDISEKLRITSDGKIGVNRSSHIQGILHVYTDTLNADNGYNGQNFGIVVETEDSNNDGDEGNGICFTQQYSTDALDSGKVRTGAIIGYKDQATGNFGGGLKFKVQQFGATPLLTSMTMNKSGNVGIGTEIVGDKLVVHQGSDDDIIVRVNGADSTTEYAGLGVGSGYASVVAGGTGTTNTDLVFMTSNQGTEAGRWRINKDGILYNMESGYTYNFKRYQGTVPNMTAGNWYTVANTTTISDAGLWILTFGRFEQSQTGGTQWSVTYVGGPVYLHSANGNDGDVVTVPLVHMGHAQNGSGASCRLTYYSGSAHSSGRVQFKPNGWSYTGTNAHYRFFKIADL